jgi:hypothetical protein
MMKMSAVPNVPRIVARLEVLSSELGKSYPHRGQAVSAWPISPLHSGQKAISQSPGRRYGAANLGLPGFPRKSYTVTSDVYAQQTRQTQVHFLLRVTREMPFIQGVYTTRIERRVTYTLQLVHRTADAFSALVQDMRVNHRCLDALVAEKLLPVRTSTGSCAIYLTVAGRGPVGIHGGS